MRDDYHRVLYQITLMAGLILFLLLNGYTDEKTKESQQKELDRITKLIKEYIKSTSDEEQTKLKAQLAEVKNIPPLATITKIIKDVPSYPKLEPIKRQTRKIKVGDEEYTYELSPPQGYSPHKEFPLVISLHGAGGDGMNALHFWRIPPQDQELVRDQIIQRIKEAGQTPPPKEQLTIRAIIGTNDYIIVAPSLQKDPKVGVPADLSGKLIPILLNDVLSICNVDTNRIFISGFSMGGHITWSEILTDPNLFAGAIPLAGACPDKNYLVNLANLPMYIIHGEKDEVVSVDYAREASKILKDLKYDVTYREIKGMGHHQWSASDSGENTKLLAWLKSKSRNPFPKKIVYRPSSADKKRIYWLELTEMSGPSPSLEADIKDNKISIKSEGLDKLTILFNSEMVDFAKEIVVTVNGAEVFKERITPSLQFLLDDYLKHKDPKVIFTARVELDLATR